MSNLQPNVQEPNTPGGIKKSTQQLTEVRLLKLLVVIKVLEWLGQTWPGLKELAHDLLAIFVRIVG
jgi:hypothetical protein